MKLKHLRLKRGFRVAAGNRRSQAAEMTLTADTSTGSPTNRHRGSDQWLFVVSGSGAAIVNGKRHRLRSGSLLFVEHGDAHEIINVGKEPLRTVNFYVPPAYKKDGTERPAGKS